MLDTDIVLFSSYKAESQGIICIRGRVDELNKKINLKMPELFVML